MVGSNMPYGGRTADLFISEMVVPGMSALANLGFEGIAAITIGRR